MIEQMVITEMDSRGVATVTLNNPDKHNVFDDELIAQISATFEVLDTDPAGTCGCFTGRWPEFFSRCRSGLDATHGRLRL